MAEYQVGQIYERLKESDLYILTEFFKMLGNPTRIRIHGATRSMERSTPPPMRCPGIIFGIRPRFVNFVSDILTRFTTKCKITSLDVEICCL